jgi:TM2 domain-containing membrane protein YozV
VENNMDRNKQQISLGIVGLVVSMGFLGYMAWKLGVMDFILQLCIQFATMFMIMFVIVGVMDPLTYNMYVDGFNGAIDALKNKFSKTE